jgi:hypothetical protein
MIKRASAALFAAIVVVIAVEPSVAKGLDSLKAKVDSANASALRRADQLKAVLPLPGECNTDPKSVYAAFDREMTLADVQTALYEALGGPQRARETNAEARLDVAAAALAVDCIAIADLTFRSVLDLYKEQRFAGYRDRAKIGVDDVRERRRTK